MSSDTFFKFPSTPYLCNGMADEINTLLRTMVVEINSLLRRDICYVNISEKLDGTNVGISFVDGELKLQHRGGYVVNNQHEFDLLKKYVAESRADLWDMLKDRYILFGEWLYYKHTVFYGNLPTYFVLFDIYDKRAGLFLSYREICSVFYKCHGDLRWLSTIHPLEQWRIGKTIDYDLIVDRAEFLCTDNSRWIGPYWRRELEKKAKLHRLDFDVLLSQSQKQNHPEGVYIKIEDSKQVLLRCKVVNPDFAQTIEDSGHWQKRQPIKNIAIYK